MALARWQATIQDEAGNVVPAAQITVRREISGAPLAILYSDRAGASPIGNPFNADADGFAAFHVAGGSYRIDAVSGDLTRTWRYVPIGLAGESDAITSGLPWRFDSATADGNPTAGYMRLNNATMGSVTKLFISETNAQDADLSAWLATWDDGGSSINRGTVVIQSQSGGSLFVGTVTGSVVDDGGYRDISVTPVATTGAFVADETLTVQFLRAGIDGSGDVSSTLTLTAGAGLTGGGDLSANRTFAVGAGTGILANADDVAVDKASNANVRASASNKVITTDLLEAASGLVTITDGATITPDWDAFINGQITLAGNRTLAIPSNLQTGTWRSIWIQGNDGTDRTLALDAGYLGPHHAAWEALTFNSSTKRYIMSIFALNSSTAVIMGAPLGPF